MKGKFPAAPLKELLDEHLRNRTLEYELRHREDKAALLRRIADIRRGKSQRVTLKVADNICTAFGRPDWLQLIS